jgi:hypothetical protein
LPDTSQREKGFRGFSNTGGRVASSSEAGEAVHMLDAVEDFFDRHAQHRLVDIAQDEQTLQRLAEGVKGLVQTVLLGIGNEPAEDVRGGRFLELDGGDEAQDVVPELNDVILVDLALRLDLPARAIDGLATPEDIASLPLEVLERRCVGDADQITGGKDRLAVARDWSRP